MRAAKQILLCLGSVSVVIFSFTLAITALTFTVPQPVNVEVVHEWKDMGTIITTLMQMALGVMDLAEIHGMVEHVPLLFVTLRDGPLGGCIPRLNFPMNSTTRNGQWLN